MECLGLALRPAMRTRPEQRWGDDDEQRGRRHCYYYCLSCGCYYYVLDDRVEVALIAVRPVVT
jgi:hypothetical protein